MRSFIGLMCLASFTLLGCSSDDDSSTATDTSATSADSSADATTGDAATTTEADSNGADALPDVITAADGPGAYDPDFRTSAGFFTNMTARVLGTSPHGTQQTWYSSNIEALIASDAFTVPVGTVAIKEFDMDSDGTPDGIAVMIKKPAGYDAANQDWYYEMRTLDGTVKADPPAGATEMCISCHVHDAATDYLAATKIK
jgi:hypothetical protein